MLSRSDYMLTEEQLRQEALNHYGSNYQLIVTIEECSELIKTLTKILRYGRSPELIDAAKEESADVHLMLGQLGMMWGSVKHLELEKLRRLHDKIQDEKRRPHQLSPVRGGKIYPVKHKRSFYRRMYT